MEGKDDILKKEYQELIKVSQFSMDDYFFLFCCQDNSKNRNNFGLNLPEHDLWKQQADEEFEKEERARRKRDDEKQWRPSGRLKAKKKQPPSLREDY